MKEQHRVFTSVVSVVSMSSQVGVVDQHMKEQHRVFSSVVSVIICFHRWVWWSST